MMRSSEEAAHRLVEVPQRLLLHHLAPGPQPCVLRASTCELPTLFEVSRRAGAAWSPPCVLLDRQVPDKSRVPVVLSQYHFLHGRRHKAVARHTRTLAIGSDIPEGQNSAITEEVKRCFLSYLV
jgi:hypothetical protein